MVFIAVYCILKRFHIIICYFQKLENLHYLKHLRKLYLYSNKIQKIENLEQLTELEILWLNHNEIVNIEVNVKTVVCEKALSQMSLFCMIRMAE